MATFIKGVSDQLGPMQLYRPDYQFLTQVYGTKQAQYDRGFNMVKSLYNSVLNTNLTNANNQSYRQEAFKRLQGSLQSMSNVDLSNPTNITRAQGMIDPISRDPELAYDMAVTSFHSKQKQLMESYRNSQDPKMRGMYNEYSRMDINFAEEDLRNAKRGDGSITSVQPREFTPFEDVNEFLRKAAKDQGLEIKQSSPDGRGYILTRTNGPGAVPIYNSWATATMGNQFDRQFSVIGRVNAESAIRSEMANKNVGREEATRMVAEKLLPQLNVKQSVAGIAAQEEYRKLDEKVTFYEKQFPNGFPTAKPEIAQEYQRLVKERDEQKTEFENARSEVGRLQSEGSAYIASNLYNIYSQAAKDQTALAFASTFATAKQSVEVRPDTTWATKVSIASRERIAGAQMAMAQKKMEFEQYKLDVNTKLKIQEMQGKGLIPSTEFTGVGFSDTPSYASDMNSASLQLNRDEAYSSAFNAENGLIKLVVDDDSEYGKVFSSIAKIKQMANGQQVTLSNEELNNLKSYGNKVGMNIDVPTNSSDANNFLDRMAGYTFNKATERLQLYSDTHKTGDTNPYFKSFRSGAGAFQNMVSQREAINKDMKRVSQEVLDANGNIKPLYEGAVIKSKISDGVYDFDFSKVSEAAKTRVSSLITGFKDRQVPVSNQYTISKLTGAEIDLLVKNPYGVSSVTTSEGATLDINVLRNMNPVDISALFADKSKVFYDPVRKQVKVEMNVSEKDGIAKKFNLKGGQALYLTIPYETIQSSRGALGRLEEYIPFNTLNVSSLGVLTPLLTNANARVVGESYMNGIGFDYAVTGVPGQNGSNLLQFDYKYLDPQTGKTGTGSQMIPFSPGDPASLEKASEIIQQVFYNYKITRSKYQDYINSNDTQTNND
jgi:hypothetical protein